MKRSRPPSPDEASGASRNGTPEPEPPAPTSQPRLLKRLLELPDGRYEIAYERAPMTDDA